MRCRAYQRTWRMFEKRTVVEAETVTLLDSQVQTERDCSFGNNSVGLPTCAAFQPSLVAMESTARSY